MRGSKDDFQRRVAAIREGTRSRFEDILAHVRSYDDLGRVLLTDTDPKQRSNVAALLVELHDRRTALLLVKALRDDPDPEVRGSAADALGFLHDGSRQKRTSRRAVRPLLHALRNDPDAAVRERAASALRFIDTEPGITDALIAAMADTTEEPLVREMVAEALGYHDLAPALPALTAALSDPSPNVRYWSASTLSGCGDPSLIPALERLLADDTLVYEPGWDHDPHGTVAEAAAFAIASLQRTAIDDTEEDSDIS